MQDVLFIAMEFPPVNTTGNFRSLKFVKYLRSYGVNPIVLTIDIESGKEIFKAQIEPSLLDEIPKEIQIYRHPVKNWPKESKHKIIRFLNQFLRTEDIIGNHWISKEFWTLIDKIADENNLKSVYVSIPPVSAGNIALKISKKLKLPLIVDMRDAWSQWCSSPFPSYLHYRVILSKEERLFKFATKIIGVTDELVNSFQNVHPNIDPAKFVTIPNGFDEPLQNPLKNIAQERNLDKQKFRIGYVGSFYYSPEAQAQLNKKWYQRKGHRMLNYVSVKQDWTYRSPYFFLTSLARLIIDHPKYKELVTFEYIGKMTPWLTEMIIELNLTNQFTSHGFLPYSKTQELLNDFDTLLATSELTIGGNHYCLPSKVFDYVNANKPILAFVTDGSQKEFLKKSGLALLFPVNDPETSSLQLKKIIDEGFKFEVNLDFIESYKRSNIAKKLALEILKLND